MDSLLANYASSDEENEHQQKFPPSKIRFHENATQSEATAEEQEKHGDFRSSFSSLESRCFPFGKPDAGTKKSASSSLFSVLPQPKLSSGTSKKVVQFILPTVTSSPAADDDDDDDEGENRKQKQQPVSPLSSSAFLSSMPAPKHLATLGTVSSAMGTSRRHVLQTDSKVTSEGNLGQDIVQEGAISSANFLIHHSDATSYDYFGVHPDPGGNPSVLETGDLFGAAYSSSYPANYGDYQVETVDGNAVNSGSSALIDSDVGSYPVAEYSYGNPESMGFSTGYGDVVSSYGTSWADSATTLPESSGFSENAVRVLGKRGRKDAPTEIIEVKQEELMKNRPREDQLKLTGISLGPAYQPTSTKGKPSKLHKRKHQIGSLYFDMKQKESELTERRAKGLMTKAQTQGKYGW